MTDWFEVLIVLGATATLCAVALAYYDELPRLVHKTIRALKRPKKTQPDVHALLTDYYTARHHEREIARTQWEREFANAQIEAIGDQIQKMHNATFSPGGYVPVRKNVYARSRAWSGHAYACECRYCNLRRNLVESS